MSVVIKIGIINCKTGKIVKEKILKDDSLLRQKQKEFQNKVLDEVKKMSQWFDGKDTFFSGEKIWKYWERTGDTIRFESVLKGTSLGKIAALSVVVFTDNNGEEHEFYVERTEEAP